MEITLNDKIRISSINLNIIGNEEMAFILNNLKKI